MLKEYIIPNYGVLFKLVNNWFYQICNMTKGYVPNLNLIMLNHGNMQVNATVYALTTCSTADIMWIAEVDNNYPPLTA